MKAKLRATKNNLPENLRENMIAILKQTLVDLLDLGLQAKQAHWNVKGPHFIALHELFDKVAGELEGFADDIAERSVALGGMATGTIQAVSKLSRLAVYPVEATSGGEHIEALSGALAQFGKAVRSAIDTASSEGDADTADLFTGVSRGVDKLLWLVEVHSQAED